MASFGTRRVRGMAAVGATIGVLALPSAPAAAHAPTVDQRKVTNPVANAQFNKPLDGFVIGYLPDPIGTPSDFQYEWENVTFHSRDWESRTESGWQVDLTVQTLRGDTLTNLAAVRQFLVSYLEKNPDKWRLDPFTNGPYHGYITNDRAFWFVRPGLAASVHINPHEYNQADLTATAHNFQPA